MLTIWACRPCRFSYFSRHRRLARFTRAQCHTFRGNRGVTIVAPLGVFHHFKLCNWRFILRSYVWPGLSPVFGVPSNGRISRPQPANDLQCSLPLFPARREDRRQEGEAFRQTEPFRLSAILSQGASARNLTSIFCPSGLPMIAAWF